MSEGGPQEQAENNAEQDVEGARTPGDEFRTRMNTVGHPGVLLDVDASVDCEQRKGAEEEVERRMIIPALEAVKAPGLEGVDDMQGFVVGKGLRVHKPEALGDED